jgi:hypothetical protein
MFWSYSSEFSHFTVIFLCDMFQRDKRLYKDQSVEKGGPTVESEVNGVSKSKNERGPFLVWFAGLVVRVQEIFFMSWLL